MHEYENGSSFEALINENVHVKNTNHDWMTMVYPKKKRKKQVKEENFVDLDKEKSHEDSNGKSIFQSLELHEEERKR